MPSSVYGSMAPRRAASQSATAASLAYPQASSAIAGATRTTASGAPGTKPRSSTDFSAFTFGPGLDELGISIGGVRTPASETLDGPVGQEDAAEVASAKIVAVSDRPEPIRAAPVAGEPGGADSQGQGEAAAVPPAPEEQKDAKVPRRRAFDVSRGTPLDPLRNKTYDLNYAKTVPAIK